MTRPLRTVFRFSVIGAATLGVLCFCFFVFFAHPVLAADPLVELQSFGDSTNLPQTDLILIIARIIRVFLSILGIIFLCLILYAGYEYMTSQGEAAKTAKARKIIYAAVIGLVIIFASFAIVSFVLDILLGNYKGQVTSKAPVEKYSEPLSGALGAGIIESHYPPRGALDIPRNTKIFVTFKEPIDPTTIIKDFDIFLSDGNSAQKNQLMEENVKIFENGKGESNKLASDKVKVTTIKGTDPTKQYTIFVFDPVELLGNPIQDTNYTVALKPNIKTFVGKNAFTGVYSSGYGWTFEVSTEVDLTPPNVLSYVPGEGKSVPRNVTVELTFNEAMDPISSTGSYVTAKSQTFSNIEIKNQKTPPHEQGIFEISNGYKTVGFTSIDACGIDPCGDTIYCLAGAQTIHVFAHAATIDTTNIPQATFNGVYDGLTDAAGNSLDGDGDGVACGSAQNNTTEEKKKFGLTPKGDLLCPITVVNDDFDFTFSTTNEVNDDVPKISKLTPGINEGNIDPSHPLEIEFDIPLKSTTVNSTNVSLWPDPLYKTKSGQLTSLWFTSGVVNGNNKAKVLINHPTLISEPEGKYVYYPVVTHGVKSNYQICMYPSMMTGSVCDGSKASEPYCCAGLQDPWTSSKSCGTSSGKLPGNE